VKAEPHGAIKLEQKLTGAIPCRFEPIVLSLLFAFIHVVKIFVNFFSCQFMRLIVFLEIFSGQNAK